VHGYVTHTFTYRAAVQELVLVTLDGLSVEWHAGATGGVSYTQLLLKLRNIQVRW
jgi:hypothetical protein